MIINSHVIVWTGDSLSWVHSIATKTDGEHRTTAEWEWIWTVETPGTPPAVGRHQMTLRCLPWKADLTARDLRPHAHVRMQTTMTTQTGLCWCQEDWEKATAGINSGSLHISKAIIVSYFCLLALTMQIWTSEQLKVMLWSSQSVWTWSFSECEAFESLIICSQG